MFLILHLLLDTMIFENFSIDSDVGPARFRSNRLYSLMIAGALGFEPGLVDPLWRATSGGSGSRP